MQNKTNITLEILIVTGQTVTIFFKVIKMYYNKVELCGINTSSLCVLTEEQKKDLLCKSKQGDTNARHDMIYGNLRLVLSVIRRFSGKHENLDDLFQVGCIGLVKAVDNFNTQLDVKFSTYAVPMIIGEIRRYLRDNTAIRISRSIRDLAYRALQVKEEFSAEYNREPSIDEISKKLGCERIAVASAMEAIVDPVSIYEPVYNENGDSVCVMDKICDTTTGDDVWLENIALQDAVKNLDNREQKIIYLRYYKDKTQTQIAEIIGISQAQVSRIEKNALQKIKKRMT